MNTYMTEEPSGAVGTVYVRPDPEPVAG